MKVLLVNMTIDPITGGGSANRIIQIAEAIVKYSEVECTILTTNKGLDKNFKLQNDKLKIELLPCLNERFYFPYFSWRRINEIVSKADLIHLMSHWTIINVIIYLAVKFQKKTYTFCPAGTLHIFGRSSFIKKIYNFIIGKKIIKNASRCIAITELEKQEFSKFDVSEEKVVVIPNGIDCEIFYPNFDANYKFQKKYNLINIPYVLFMGRLNKIKGPDILLKAYKKLSIIHPDLHLVIAGPDEGLGNQLTEEVKIHSLEDKVHLIGYIGGDDKVGAFTGAKLLAVPSRREAMSIVALEAGGCGTPVILTNVCGFDEVKSVGCEVVEPSPDGLFYGLQRMISSSNHLEETGRNLRSLILKHYSWEKAAKKYLDIVDSK